MRLDGLLPPVRIVALALLLIALGFGASAIDLPIWQAGMPGPGLTPLLICACLLPLSLIILFEGITPEEREPLQLAPFLCGLALLLYVYLVQQAGFVLPTILFGLAWARLLYRQSWTVSLAAACLVPLALCAVFVGGLGIPLALWPE